MSSSKLSNRSTSRITTTPKVPEKSHKNAKGGEQRTSQEHGNITIRLSDLGIIQRSPSQIELQIQADRILYILDKTIQKLQVAVCLPRLLRRKACMLKRFMPEQEVDFIQSVCLKYSAVGAPILSNYGKSSIAQTLSTAIEKISMNESKRRVDKLPFRRDFDNLVDPHMAQVLEMLWTNRGLREKVLAEFPRIAECPSTILVDCLKSLKDTVAYRLSITALDERKRDRRLRKAWNASTSTEDNIEKTKVQLEKQREDLGRQLVGKNEIISDYVSKIEALKMKFSDEIKHKILESEKEMSEDTHTSELRQTDLSAESKIVTQQYETLLSQNLSHEKSLRTKRLKIETQLCSWLTKYDTDIGDRQAEFEQITKAYEEEKAEMEALQEKFDEQEEEYLVLLAEKEEEEHQMREEKAYAFLMIRSARIIQRFWRAYRQRKLDKKNAKKGGKGKGKKDKSEDGGKPPKGKKEEKLDAKGDPMATLDKKFGGEILDDLKGDAFPTGKVVVDLAAD